METTKEEDKRMEREIRQGKWGITAVKLLKEVMPYINVGGVTMTNAVYISPAQQLRNSANELEAKEALTKRIDQFLKDILKD